MDRRKAIEAQERSSEQAIIALASEIERLNGGRAAAQTNNYAIANRNNKIRKRMYTRCSRREILNGGDIKT